MGGGRDFETLDKQERETEECLICYFLFVRLFDMFDDVPSVITVWGGGVRRALTRISLTYSPFVCLFVCGRGI